MLMMTIYDDDDVDVGNLPEGTDFKLEGRSFMLYVLLFYSTYFRNIIFVGNWGVKR